MTTTTAINFRMIRFDAITALLFIRLEIARVVEKQIMMNNYSGYGYTVRLTHT